MSHADAFYRAFKVESDREFDAAYRHLIGILDGIKQFDVSTGHVMRPLLPFYLQRLSYLLSRYRRDQLGHDASSAAEEYTDSSSDSNDDDDEERGRPRHRRFDSDRVSEVPRRVAFPAARVVSGGRRVHFMTS